MSGQIKFNFGYFYELCELYELYSRKITKSSGNFF
ncbi:MAG: hypothetical protein HLUCCO16_06945 [Phormidium sp. OSCR]|nr:MAG: hypothetical protein HLUCCO16_06945 [Phormidium sp. OSCR]